MTSRTIIIVGDCAGGVVKDGADDCDGNEEVGNGAEDGAHDVAKEHTKRSGN